VFDLPRIPFRRKSVVSAFALFSVIVTLSTARAQTWTPLNNQPSAGIVNCLLLTDGAVLCQSGDRATFVSNANWYKLTPDVTGSYVNGTWSQVASMPAGYAPQAYASAVLADGRLAIVGGEYSFGSFVLSNMGAIYDPKTNIWTTVAPPTGWSYIGDAPSVVLPNGQFMIGNKLDARLALLDPATLTWTLLNPSGKSNGAYAEEGFTLLPDGSVLTVDVRGAPNSERYLSGVSSWYTAGSTQVDLHLPPDAGPITIAPGIVYTHTGKMGPVLLRPDGTVFAAGGNGHTAIFTPPPLNSTAAGTWVRGPDFPSGAAIDDGPAVVLPNGHVMVAASADTGFFDFDGTNLNSAAAPPNAANDATGRMSLLLLPNGQVMFTDFTNNVQIYTSPGTYNPSWAPTIGSVPAILSLGSTYPITGTQFNGLSQGSAYRDESQNSTNYPLLRIVNNSSNHVYYARTHGHSSMGVATGSQPVSTYFDVPNTVELGLSTLVIVANGIPSAPVPVTITGASPATLALACPATSGYVAIAYNSALLASGGRPPFAYSILTGSLGNLALNQNTGVITGIPNTPTVLNFTAKVTDSATPSAASVTVSCSLGITNVAAATTAAIVGVTAAGSVPIQQVQSYALNPYVSVLDGQWLGIKYASDGNVYFASSSRSAHHGAAFFKYNSTTQQVTMLTDDITKICGENPQTNPQGKIHSDIVEANGWLYFSTYFANDSVPGAYASYTGSHVIGYQLATGIFRDYGVVLSNYTSYSGVAVDPVRNYIYVYLTGESPGQASYMFRIDVVTGAKTNLGRVGNTYTSCFYLFLDQRGDVWFSVEADNGRLQRVHGDTGVIDSYPNELPPIYSWNQPVVDPSATNQSLRNIHWMQPLDGNRAVFTEGYYGGMLYIFDSSQPIGSGREFTNVQHIGYTDLNLALGNNRVFYHQRANRGCGHQGDGQQISICGPPPAGGVMDFHLLSVSLNASDNYAITDYGLLQDQNGRPLWRAPGMNTDHNNRVFFVGDWYTNPGEVGSLSYTYNTTTGAESYTQLSRGEFFVVANLGPAAITQNPSNVSVSAGQTATFTVATTAGSPGYQWQSQTSGGASFTNIPGTNGASYTTPVLTVADSGAQFRCIVTSSAGTFTSLTATLTVTASQGSSAVYMTSDTVTHGTWKGAYGGNGYVIAGDSSSLPGYAQLSNSGVAYTWVATSQDSTCVQKGSAQATDRICAVWYGSSSFTIDLTVSGAAQQVALYALDWDKAQRVQRIDVLDGGNGTTLDTRTISGFSTGTYLVWNIAGHVQFKVTKVGGPNAVIAGIFFGGSGATVTAPVITQNPVNASVNVGQNATFNVTATGGNLSYQWQSAPSGSSTFTNINGAVSSSYTTPTLALADNGTQFRAVVSNSGGSPSSNAATLTVTVAGATAGAVFLSTDGTTRGAWSGKYGTQGSSITSLTSNLPSYAQVVFTGASAWNNGASSDPAALQTGTGGIMSCWYGATQFSIDLNLTDGATHQVALYVVDWLTGGRAETITVTDAATAALLNSQSVTSFVTGQYLVWNVQGHVKITITRSAGPNAVLSGIFLDPVQGSGGGSAPVITQNPASISAAAGQTATFTVAASGSGIGYQWQSHPNGGATFSNIGGATTASYTTPSLTSADNGSQYRAVASSAGGAVTSTPAILTVTAGATGASAAFVAADTTTHGSWQGSYGSQGYAITAGANLYPAYAQVTLNSASLWNAGPSSDPAALQTGGGLGLMSCWYGGTQFSFDLNLTDAASHRIALYFVDWLNGGRVQTITITDASTGAVLSTQTASNFLTGQYLIWNIRGHVIITVVRTAGPNPVASGVFVD
jgi:hypothetical protein